MHAVRFVGPVRATLYGVLLACVYYSTFHWLVTMDWPREDYSSSALVPLIVLYLLWGKRRELANQPSVPSWRGFALLVPGIAFFWLGELSGEYFSLYLSFWLTLVGLCWLHLGWRKLNILAFPLAFLLAAFPLPNFINNKMSLQLKLLSSRLGVRMLQVYGLSAYREGNIIDLGFTRLQVVDACSGIRYLVPLVVMGVLMAYFFRAALWKKVAIVASTLPLSIVTNALRIASVGILYQYWGQRAAEGFMHDFSGWFIFMATLGLLAAEMWAIRKFLPERAGTSAIASRPVVPERETGGRSAGASPWGWSGLPQSVAAILLLGATFALAQGVNFREKVPAKKPFDRIPLSVGGWRGVRNPLGQEFIDALKFSDYTMVDFQDGQGRSVNFYTAYYASQSKGRSVHTPETCLPGGGWVFEESGLATIPLGGTAGGSLRVSRAILYKDGTKELTYYWFPQRGRVLTSMYQLKMYALWDALTRQRTDGALVRLITQIYPAEKPEDAEARLQAFTREIMPVLSQFLPGRDDSPP